MGLGQDARYTRAMTSHDSLLLESGDLSVCPELGEVRNARGESTRLGPVNMKVLALLMSRPGQVVGRAEVFESVWRNQVVGDDALTRSISDIRAEINRLSERRGLIETLPKRGYRWTADVRRASASPLRTAAGPAAALAAEPPGARRRSFPAAPAEQRRAPSTAPAEVPPTPAGALADVPRGKGGEAMGRNRASASGRRRLLVWAGRGVAYALVLLLLASLGVWLADRLAHPGHPIVAVLPIAAEPDQRELAADIEQRLADYLIQLDLVDLLARSAVDSRPSNPYPYFFYEFGATWLIEADVRRLSPGTMLTVDLVDARTGIVLFQSTAAVGDDAAQAPLDIGPALAPLADFFEAEAGH
jgi:DNA-binding winged helix-turn-helix (wHTH) protein